MIYLFCNRLSLKKMIQYCGPICGEQSGPGDGFTLKYGVSPPDHHPTGGPFTSINVLLLRNRPDQPKYYHNLRPQFGIQH